MINLLPYIRGAVRRSPTINPLPCISATVRYPHD